MKDVLVLAVCPDLDVHVGLRAPLEVLPPPPSALATIELPLLGFLSSSSDLQLAVINDFLAACVSLMPTEAELADLSEIQAQVRSEIARIIARWIR